MMQNKTFNKKNWSQQESEKLADTIVELVNEGHSFNEAFKVASEDLNRSEYAVKKHWSSKLRENYISKIAKNDNPQQMNFDEVLVPTKKNVVNINESGILTGSIEEAERIAKSNKNSRKEPVIEGITSYTDAFNLLFESDSQIKNTPETIESAKNLYETIQNLQLAHKNVADVSTKVPYQGREKVTPKQGTTKLAALRKSIETLESENFKILNSGKDGFEYIVINNEEDKGYLVKVDGDKVVSCNCPHHEYRGAICKHLLKVAFDKNLEVF